MKGCPGRSNHATLQLILRGFAGDRRFIFKFDLKTARQYDPQHVRGVAKQRHHYMVTDAGSERLSVIDDHHASFAPETWNYSSVILVWSRPVEIRRAVGGERGDHLPHLPRISREWEVESEVKR